ncbi:hypothetical protein MRX96_023253 [Rhipicephalus microplus]
MKGRSAPRRGAHGASSGGIPPATRLASAAVGITLHTSGKQRLYSEATTRSSVPQVEPPTVVSTEVQGAPAPTTSDKGEQGEAIQAAPGEAEVEKSGEKEPRPAEASLTASKKPAPRAREVISSSQARRQPSTGSCSREELSTSGSESSRSESTLPEYKRHAATAVVDDDSSYTTVEDSEMNARSPAPCDLCKSVVCGCSELSDTSYLSTPVSPIASDTRALQGGRRRW